MQAPKHSALDLSGQDPGTDPPRPPQAPPPREGVLDPRLLLATLSSLASKQEVTQQGLWQLRPRGPASETDAESIANLKNLPSAVDSAETPRAQSVLSVPVPESQAGRAALPPPFSTNSPKATDSAEESSDESGSEDESDDEEGLRAALLRSRDLVVDLLPALIGCGIALLLSGALGALFRGRPPPRVDRYDEHWEDEEEEPR